MSRYLSSAAVIISLMCPLAATAQHSNTGGAPAVGTATPAGGGGGGSSSSGGSSSGSSSSGGGSSSSSAPVGRSGHYRGDVPANGTAAPRGSVVGSGGTIVITEGGGFYPWGYGGLAGAGLYDGFYDGYYGAYDPWYGFFPAYSPISGGGGGGLENTGALRLKVKPLDASVYVDGFFAGVVDDFDGAFQKLKLERGPHHIEIRSPQHVPVTFDVMIQEDFTITYRGELTKQ